jgi:hypothetical protein
MTRWKCWALMSVSKEELAALASATEHMLHMEMCAPAKVLKVAGK